MRRCVGAGLALLEMRTVLTTVLESVSLSPAGAKDERQRVRGVTLVPANGARVIVDGVR